MIGSWAGIFSRIPDSTQTVPAHIRRIPSRYNEQLLHLIETGRIDPTRLISHRISLDEAPDAYRHFDQREKGFTKVVLKP